MAGISWCAPGRSGRWRPATPSRVLIRPAATRLVDGHSETTLNMLAGTVVDTAYRGRGYDHVVAVGQQLISAIYDPLAYSRGRAVSVLLDADHVLAYRDGAGKSLDAERYRTDLTTVTLAMSRR